jgi:hypothetical protein
MKPAFLRNLNPGASKFSNKKEEIDGIVFDSKKEAKVYLELKDLASKGEISKFDRQVNFELIPTQRDGQNKIIERPCQYKADFVVYHNDGEITVIDAKGMREAAYRIKRKLLLYVHKIRVHEV